MAINLKKLTATKDQAWITYGNPEEGAKLLIGYARGDAFTRKVGRLTNEAMKQTKGRRLEQDVIRNINRRAMVGTLLLDFEGFAVTGDGGQDVELPREPEKRKNESMLLLLTNPLIYEFVQEQSSDLANFQEGGDPVSEPDEAAKAESKSGPVVASEAPAGQA